MHQDSTRDVEVRLEHLFLGSVDIKKQIKDLSFQLREMEATLSSHQNTAMAAESAIQEHKGEADRLRRRAQGYLALIKQKDAEILKLQEQLKERDKKVCFLPFCHSTCVSRQTPGEVDGDQAQSIG